MSRPQRLETTAADEWMTATRRQQIATSVSDMFHTANAKQTSIRLKGHPALNKGPGTYSPHVSTKYGDMQRKAVLKLN